MNALAPTAMPTVQPRRQEAFALVLVLVLLSLMAIIAVGYLSSMSAERATASAFSNKNRAEEAAQAGVDNATGVLRDYIKAFPDSATAWDSYQITNPSVAVAGAAVTPVYTEGTTLYFRAVPATAPASSPVPAIIPNRAPGVTTDATYANANCASGNGPNNGMASPSLSSFPTATDARETFVLPLVSGASATLLSNKANAVPTITSTNSINLNARRQIGDKQGWLGTRPTYTGSPAASEPFNVPWVEIKQTDGIPAGGPAPVVARYAYWVEDESFRLNINYAGPGSTPTPTPNATPYRRDNNSNPALNPTDFLLYSLVNAIQDSTPVVTTANLFSTRNLYPSQLFPEPLAFAHTSSLSATGTPTPATITRLRTMTTTQSAALNLSRHGTQRLCLNDVMYPTYPPYPTPTPTPTISPTPVPTPTPIPTPTPATDGTQGQINKIFSAIQFHLPNFGQRFYRNVWTNSGVIGPKVAIGANLNNLVVAPVSTTSYPAATPSSSPHTTIYDYKVAANIHDYIYPHAYPTVLGVNGAVFPPTSPTPTPPIAPFYSGPGANPIWAIGKGSAPLMQKCAVRFSPNGFTATTYSVNVDYYIEFWNMTDQTITCSQTAVNSDLGINPYIRITLPPSWYGYSIASPTTKYPLYDSTSTVAVPVYSPLYNTGGTGAPLTARDANIDLTQTYNAAGTSLNAPVKFPPGVTVITTDPSWQTNITGTNILTDTKNAGNANEAQNHFLICNFTNGAKGRTFTGPLNNQAGVTYSKLLMAFREGTIAAPFDYDTNVIIGNSQGYIDSMTGAIPISGDAVISLPTADVTATHKIYGGYLTGNMNSLLPSEVGDPRTNNEQLTYNVNFTASNLIDQYRYKAFDVMPVTSNVPPMTVPPTFGLMNFDSFDPGNLTTNPWPDYYWFPYSLTQSSATNSMATLYASRTAGIQTAATAPSVVANIPITSIGQLGDVFDPSRLPDISSPNGVDNLVSRGGGRTFRIGQHDDRFDPTVSAAAGTYGAYSASSGWASWRLADIFSTTDAIEQPGLLNINGLTRDGGFAFMSAYQGLILQSQTLTPGATGYDPTVHGDGHTLSASGIQNFVNDIISYRLANINPSSADTNISGDPTRPGVFFERGELAEIDGLTVNALTYLTGGFFNVDIRYLFDRTREELIRRVIDMITTRGNVFSVYVIGQSINQSNPNDATTKRVTGTHQLKVTFKLTPKTSAGLPFHPGTDSNGYPTDFDGSSTASVNARFARPDHYDIDVLSSTSGNN